MARTKRKKREIKQKQKYRPEFIFGKKNYVVFAIGAGIILLGYILMAGGGSDDPDKFNYAIYSWRRIRLAPFLVLLGFGVEVYAILLNPHKKREGKEK